MKTVFKEIQFNQEIERSKFIGYVFHIESEDEFKNKLKEIKKSHPKATHHCYAYILSNKQKSNDDGEPSGTAGLPILETTKHFDVENVGCIVVRYFGGIKLGTGGLVRAYSSTIAETLKSAEIKEVLSLPTYCVSVTYDLQNIVDQFLSKNNIVVLKKDYDISVEFLIATDDFEIKNKLVDLCLGKIKIQQLDNQNIVK